MCLWGDAPSSTSALKFFLHSLVVARRWTSGILIQKTTVSLLANGLKNIKFFQIYTLPTVYQLIKKSV
ncbi:hypothetical protein L1987_33451 [Smallanthus sonchifolius]|uniref:Uncharacterized protein n=1 Tax=Smallanthus sonchifolius TaxID=185202 RepID=A0ACB9HRF0_9ASTR|nr:hypothetical protein L1987_33451 [Smallanthus sonchifolius]